MASEVVGSTRTCSHADPDGGGVLSNGDPFGTRRKLTGESRPFTHICWTCYDEWGRDVDRANRAEVLALVRARGLCGFIEAWVGHCLNPMPCAKHASESCWKCGALASKNCEHTGAFVCGVPECDEHPHQHGETRQ